MKDHFIKLFNYDKYTNQKIAETIVATNGPEKPLGLMAHLLTAEKVWLRRINGEYKISVVLWPTWPADELELIINETHASWIDYLNTLTDADLQKLITYQNFQGHEYTMRVVDIITHVINHGTHTRAQVGVHLRLAGAEQLPVTDFAYYITNII
ncbi:MAG: DinB family protein [Mucilaginibacter sp.]|nr:DinB family protein [Mucilaginibacter sp.]